MQVKEEIASVDKAAGIKKSGAAMKSAAAPVIKKPKYDEETRWEVAVALAGDGDEMDIAVRPVQKASLLLKAWAQDVGADPEDCEREFSSRFDSGGDAGGAKRERGGQTNGDACPRSLESCLCPSYPAFTKKIRRV
jgi:hypothetical protein